MFDPKGHLTDEVLIALIDDQGSTAAGPQARAHAMECPFCQSRQLQLQHILAQVSELHSTGLASIASSSQRRAELAARLAKVQPLHPARAGIVTTRRRIQFAAVAMATLACVVVVRLHSFTHYRSTSVQAAFRLLPDKALTPGATRPVDLAKVCSDRDQDLDPAVADPVKQAVFQEYGVSGTKTADYQVDYLINPQLGGTSDVRNLWPEPYGSTAWNAYAKDALEDRLHHMVCNNQIDLASAQQEIATDWIAAYKKYFHAQTPV